MIENKTIEVDIIYKKLLKIEDEEIVEGLKIKSSIKLMNQFQEIFACRNVTSERRILGPLAVFFKRVMRKLIRWYIDPICERQTEYNKAVTIAITELAKTQADLKFQIKQLNDFKKETTEKN